MLDDTWTNLFSVEGYCQTCVGHFWVGSLTLVIFVSGFIFITGVYKGEAPLRLPKKLFGFKLSNKIKISHRRAYIYFLFTVFSIALFNSIERWTSDKPPKDYRYVKRLIDREGEQCMDGVLTDIIYRNNERRRKEDKHFDTIQLKGQPPFRHHIPLNRTGCYHLTKHFNSHLHNMVENKIGFKGSINDMIGNVEINLCWTQEKYSDRDQSSRKYSGICLYQIDAKLVGD